MQKKIQLLLGFVGLGLLAFALPQLAYADLGVEDLGNCPEGYPEGPVITVHLEQSQLLDGTYTFAEILEMGEQLFAADFNACDGQGRPATTGGGDKRVADEPTFIRTSSPDSNSCAGCHNEPRVGGSGDFAVNVFVLAQTLDPVTESVNSEFSNERNTVGMFGAGPIEMLAREMTAELHAIRDGAVATASETGQSVTAPLLAKGVSFGEITVFPDGIIETTAVRGVDSDLIIKPFHQAGKVISLREFSNNGMNHHHGMQSEERFDLNPEKGADFDEDGIVRELTIGDLTAVSLWQAALPTPGQWLPADGATQSQIKLGEALFDRIGCSSCHMPELTLTDRHFVEPNPYNPPANWQDMNQAVSFDMTTEGLGQRLEPFGDGAVVRAYTDLKRHNLCDPEEHADPIRFLCNEQLDQGRPLENGRPGAEFFLTRKLWDVGNSGPYGHRGDLTTITEAILVHGGDARAIRDAFVALPTTDQAAIVTFLKSLQVLPEGEQLIMAEGVSYEAESATSPSSRRPWAEIVAYLLLGITAVSLILFMLKKW